MSSLYRYFSWSTKPYLPNPEEEKTTNEVNETTVVNHEVEKTLCASCCRQRKRKSNFHYDPETRAKIGRFAAENGNKSVVVRFSQKLQKPLSESRVHGFKGHHTPGNFQATIAYNDCRQQNCLVYVRELPTICCLQCIACNRPGVYSRH